MPDAMLLRLLQFIEFVGYITAGMQLNSVEQRIGMRVVSFCADELWANRLDTPLDEDRFTDVVKEMMEREYADYMVENK
jgi:hypothetical protein